ncbi:uncharacterized protein LOC111614874 [Centruroides sculpturatus]|uniref:uncharacterized protein LOC111614874 n=1 Tax=Centruroides sculpturatus TaxID=218467 RepID=UPI000C6D7666|nr:uncharacterized protein LOC111614874 [Centruroides sculpturatus]
MGNLVDSTVLNNISNHLNRYKLDYNYQQAMYHPRITLDEYFSMEGPMAPTNFSIYTDGSRSVNGVGCAFVVMNKNKNIYQASHKLANHCTANQAESLAIYRALQWIHKNNASYKFSNITIYSDSCVALLQLKNLNIKHNLVHKSVSLLLTLKENITINFSWVRGHSGVSGNERADLLARTAHTRCHNYSYDLTPPIWMKNVIRDHTWKIWQNSWKFEKIQKLRSEDLLLETASPQQSAKLLAIKTLGDIKATITPHGSLNLSRGVISEIDLMSEDESDIQIGLSDQGVTAVRRISIHRDGKLIATKHLILTFNKSTLPSFITAGYLRCPVRPYVPNPLRCFKCQQFGHSQTSCRGKSVCAQCGTEDHVSTECKSIPCCVNCRDAHPSYSRKCPAWHREKEVQRLKTINNILYTEARRMVTQSLPTKQKTFAAVLKSTKTCGVQTDISVSPKESLRLRLHYRKNGIKTPRRKSF